MNEKRIIPLRRPDGIDDPRTEILRSGARRSIAQSRGHADPWLAGARARIVRHGHAPVRAIQTGIGPVEIARPKARDCGAAGEASAFASRLRSAGMGKTNTKPRRAPAG